MTAQDQLRPEPNRAEIFEELARDVGATPPPSAPAKTPTLAERSFSSTADVDELVDMVERFERGELTPDQFRAYRLIRGIYGQRQDDYQMIRVKIPAGVLLPEQLEVLAEVARDTPRNAGHVTTRQNLQFHFLRLHELGDHLRRLDAVGLTTRGACGNAVRNVTACARAGLCTDEAFDTTPFADAITRHFLRRPLAEGLPRKFKIALSGCEKDCALAAINDVGLVAHRAPDGSRRFRVLAAGGLSTLPTSAFPLHESYPAERILEVVEALCRLFDRTGNRENRSKARLKFVVKKLGREAFIEAYQAVLDEVIDEGETRALTIDDVRERKTAWTLPPFANKALARFVRTNVTPTIHVGRVFVTVKLPVGDATSEQLHGLAELARRFGDGTVRLSVSQNLLFRDVAVTDLRALHEGLDALGLATADADTSADPTSCPGADTCKLAITNSKDLSRDLTAKLERAPQDGVTIKLSGCPNACGQHHIATIGFHGAVRKIGGRAAPHYVVLVGGGVDAGGAKFGKVAGKVPARRVHETIERLVALAERSKRGDETVAAWLERADQEVLKREIFDLTELGDRATEEDFIDIGAEGPFRVVELEGECAA